MAHIVDVSGRECHLYKDSNAEFLLVQPIDAQIDNTILEWNPGNHFIDSEKRTAKGFVWVMNMMDL